MTYKIINNLSSVSSNYVLGEVKSKICIGGLGSTPTNAYKHAALKLQFQICNGKKVFGFSKKNPCLCLLRFIQQSELLYLPDHLSR